MADDWAPPESDFTAPAADSSWAPPESDFAPAEKAAPAETTQRVAGLGDRSLIKGIGQLADTPGALMELADRAGASAHDYIRGVFGLKPNAEAPVSFGSPATSIAENASDTLGLPKPETTAEKVGSAAVSALPTAALSPASPILGGLSAAAGAGTSEGIKEAGGNKTAQVLGGLAAGSIPSLASVGTQGARALLRDSAEDTQSRIADAATSGTQLTVGQATGSKLLQKGEAVSGALWGGGPLDKFLGEQSGDLHDHLSGIIDGLTPQGAEVSPMGAGAAINKGVAATNQRMRQAEGAAYDKVDALVPPETPVDVSHSVQIAKQLAAPTSSEALNSAVASPGISKFAEALDASAPDGQLPYGDLSKLRTAVGAKIDRGFAPANPSENGAYKALYGSLTAAKNAGASSVSDDARQAVGDASSLYAANSAQREALSSIVDKAGGPEAVFQAATGNVKNGATKIGQVMGAIGPDEQNLVRATVLNRMGRAISSNQDSTGTAFSPNTFLTKWSDMSPQAKDALFGSGGVPADLRTNLDSFTRTLSTLKSSGALKNPSGTGKLLGHAIGASNAMSDIMIGLFTGHPVALSGLALPAVNNVAARALTNPKVVNWLSQSFKAPTSTLPAAVNQLGTMNDPDAKALHDYLTSATQPQPIARASGGRVDVDTLVNRLIKRWRDAKKQTDKSTEPLLKQSDSTIVRALEIAGRAL